MAQVWEADDLVLSRRVAVKLLHPHLVDDPVFVARFREEAKAAARLTHPSIVNIFDTASDVGIEAIVMELIDGMTLRQFLDRYGPLALEDACDLATRVADALSAAHGAGIVHRDVKPANIMLCPDRRVKVTDFGIAKALEGSDLTAPDTMLGTAKYLSPEQVEGGPIDHRADVYSLGVVLYECLTGHPPFSEDNDTATALARLHRPPPSMRSHRPDLAPGVDEVILRSLAREPEDRQPSAPLLAAELEAAATAPPPPPPAAPEPPVDRTLVAAPPKHTPSTRESDRRRPWGPLLVLALVAACVVLGITLIAATGAGRDFFNELRDDLSGDGPSAVDPTPAPDQTASATADPTSTPGQTPEATTADQVVAGPAPSLPIAAATDFDPFGGDGEHSDRVAFVLDDDTDTYWHSESYDDRDFGNLKPGVGIVLELDRERTLRELTVVARSQGWAAQIHVADTASEVLEDWGEPIDRRVDAGTDTTFDLRGVRGSVVLVWITDLGDGAAPGTRVELVELSLS